MCESLNSAQNPGVSNSELVNTRNKCRLKLGHSLMDWIRLGNSGVDLSGTRGALISVSPEELAKHKTQNNAWIALRGKVYNVTPYMDFHPGGVSQLMSGVGTDVTEIFEKIHGWVNYEKLLSKCLIGPYEDRLLHIKSNSSLKLSEISDFATQE